MSGAISLRPVDRFEARLNSADHWVAEAARALLKGERVRSADEDVAIAFGAKAPLAEIYVRAAEPDVQFKLLIYARPLSLKEISILARKSVDPRGHAAAERWRRVLSETEQDWELFNCNITGVQFASA